MKFRKEFLQAVVYDDSDTANKVSDEIVGTGRWSIDHELVFEYEGKHYRVTYAEGATEMQDERPFEYSSNEIECQEVVETYTLTTIWKPVIAGLAPSTDVFDHLNALANSIDAMQEVFGKLTDDIFAVLRDNNIN